MPAAQKLPRKYLSIITDSVGDLKSLAQRMGRLAEEVERTGSRQEKLALHLRTLQSHCYAAALRLSEVEVSSDCGDCSSSIDTAERRLINDLTVELDRLARLAREGIRR